MYFVSFLVVNLFGEPSWTISQSLTLFDLFYDFLLTVPFVSLPYFLSFLLYNFIIFMMFQISFNSSCRFDGQLYPFPWTQIPSLPRPCPDRSPCHYGVIIDNLNSILLGIYYNKDDIAKEKELLKEKTKIINPCF